MSSNPNPKERAEDVEYQLFWKEVAEAARLVELNHALSYNIERGNRRADIYWWWPDMDESIDSHVCIQVFEVEPKQPTLLVP